MLGLKPGWPVIISVVTAVAGVFVMRLDDADAAFDLGDHTTLAALCGVASSLFTAVAMLGLHRLHWINTHAVVAHFSAVSALFCLGAVFCFGLEKPLENLVRPTTLVLFLGLGLSATIGQVLLTKAFSTGAPAEVAVVNLSTVVMSLMFDIFLFGKSVTWWNLIGMTLVMVPTAWVILMPRLRGKPAEEIVGTAESPGSGVRCPVSNAGE
jgi:drug/metabolite transporter (DMT)-like permease